MAPTHETAATTSATAAPVLSATIETAAQLAMNWVFLLIINVR